MPAHHHRPGIVWGGILFVLVMATVVGLYLYDVVNVSMNRNNVILVLPLSILVLALCLLVVIRTLLRRDNLEAERPEVEALGTETRQSTPDLIRALLLLALLGLYVFSYRIIGFDTATFVFMVVALVLLGHRKPVFVLGYSLVFTLVVVGGARLLLSYPMPMLLL